MAQMRFLSKQIRVASRLFGQRTDPGAPDVNVCQRI
jgi:hypothetical protein